MENKVIFQQGMDIDPDDFNDLEGFVQQTFDDLVGDAITASQRFAGFNVTKSATTQVSVDVGRLYSGGKMYVQTAQTTQDFIQQLPVAGQRIVSVVLNGTEVDTNLQPREFLINEDTGASQPKTVALTHARLANVNFSYGVEAPSAVAPILSAGYTKVADILLTTTGIGSITMYAANQLQSVDALNTRTDALETFEAQIGPKVGTLTSDLASLSTQLSSSADSGLVGRILQRLAVLEFKDQIPTTNTDSIADYFLDTSYVDTTNALSHVKVEEGLRFPDYNASDSLLAVANPLDPTFTVKSGVVFPAYTRQLWLNSGPYTADAQISAYTYTSHDLVQKTMTRQRVRYGTEFTVCSNSAFWQSGTYDPISGIFTLPDGETFKASVDITAGIAATNFNDMSHIYVRLQEFWTDDVTTNYWDNVTVDHTVSGAQIAETFLQGQDMWLDAVGVYFTKLADTGSAFLSIVEVGTDGIPDLTSCISHTEITRSQMSLYPAETQVSIQPTMLSAGSRYAILLTTAADHWVATTAGENFTLGTFFYVLDGAYAQGDGTRDIMFNLYRAQFNANRAVVTMNSVNLAGGIQSIDILAGTISPGQCSVNYQIQPSGSGTWYNLADVGDYIPGQGGSVPVLCGLRAVLTGSVDLMPAISLTSSNVHLSRPDVTKTTVFKVWTFPTGVTTNKVYMICRYEGWNAAYNTATAAVLTGTNYTTVTTPTSFVDNVSTDEYGQTCVERTYTYTLPAAVSSCAFKLTDTTTTSLKTFHTAWAKRWI